jgi:hypothetical protein
MPHRPALPPKRNRSSIELPRFHGISFRIIGRRRAAVYHQLDGSIEAAAICTCGVQFSSGNWGWPDFQEMRVERSGDCPIDEHRMEALRMEEVA